MQLYGKRRSRLSKGEKSNFNLKKLEAMFAAIVLNVCVFLKIYMLNPNHYSDPMGPLGTLGGDSITGMESSWIGLTL